MKILHIIPHFLPSQEFGGTPVVVDTLCKGLAQHGHTVHVLTTDVDTPDKRLPKRLSHEVRDGYEVFRFPNLNNWLAHRLRLSTAWRAYFFLRQHIPEYDVVHLHEYRTTLNVFAAVLKSHTQAKFILHPQGTFENFLHRTMIKTLWDKLFSQLLLDNVDTVIAISEVEKKAIQQLSPQLEVTTVYNPLIHSQSSITAHSNSHSYILYLGRIAPQKGLEGLITQFSRLKDSNQLLLIAGNDDGLLPQLQQQVRELHLSDRIEFLGTVSGKKKSQLLANATAVVYVTGHDAFGLVPCEAALAGTWPIYSQQAGVAEVLLPLHIGEAIEYGNQQQLQAALKKVLTTPPKVTEKQQQQLAKKLSLEEAVMKLEKVYSS